MAQRSSGRSSTAGGVSAPVSRRDLLRGLSAASLLAVAGSGRAVARALSPTRSRPSVVVVGAGAFGAFSALSLLRAGARVTLVDAGGPGNSRSSSGGETRVIRGVYGPDRVYVEMVARAFDLWRENERRWNRKLYHPTGAIWLVTGPDDFIRAAMPLLAERGFPFEELSTVEARRRWPQIDYEGIRWVFREERAGYLLALPALMAVVWLAPAATGAIDVRAVGRRRADRGHWERLGAHVRHPAHGRAGGGGGRRLRHRSSTGRDPA